MIILLMYYFCIKNMKIEDKYFYPFLLNLNLIQLDLNQNINKKILY